MIYFILTIISAYKSYILENEILTDISDELVFKIYKELLQTIKRKLNLQKWTRNLDNLYRRYRNSQ